MIPSFRFDAFSYKIIPEDYLTIIRVHNMSKNRLYDVLANIGNRWWCIQLPQYLVKYSQNPSSRHCPLSLLPALIEQNINNLNCDKDWRYWEWIYPSLGLRYIVLCSTYTNNLVHNSCSLQNAKIIYFNHNQKVPFVFRKFTNDSQ